MAKFLLSYQLMVPKQIFFSEKDVLTTFWEGSHKSYINYNNKGGVFDIQKVKVCTLGDDNAHNTDHVDVRFLRKVIFQAFQALITSKK